MPEMAKRAAGWPRKAGDDKWMLREARDGRRFLGMTGGCWRFLGMTGDYLGSFG